MRSDSPRGLAKRIRVEIGFAMGRFIGTLVMAYYTAGGWRSEP